MTVVSLLLSNDQPIVLTLVEEQVEEEAESVNGEVTVASFDGLLMVTPARAGSERVRTADDVMKRFLKSFIGFLCDLKAQISPTPTRSLSQAQVELGLS